MSSCCITKFASYKNNTLTVNGVVEVEACSDFNAIYEQWNLNYPKFFKMDNLSKLVLLTCEKLLEGNEAMAAVPAFKKGLVFSTADGSLDTDERYLQSTETAPSPALFVYTLPNIAVGELSIRHGLKGETATFMVDTWQPEMLAAHVQSLFDEGRVEACVAGWANFYGENAEAFFYLAQQTNNGLPHSTKNIQSIY
ncbi:MAG: hypothetical protein KF872_04145 [Chitinophagales bacterium]|nr:hypothetical protein [Chitinophagales bacterium]